MTSVEMDYFNSASVPVKASISAMREHGDMPFPELIVDIARKALSSGRCPCAGIKSAPAEL